MHFHKKCGSLVILNKDRKIATRNHGAEEYNNGLLFSEFPLVTNCIFEVQITQKMSSWNGSIEIGVVLKDPEELNLPSSATCLIDGAWILSGSTLINNSRVINDNYLLNLEQLDDGDKVGVMRKSTGALHFYKNGVDMGVAVNNVPRKLWAVVDMYGKCVQVAISGPDSYTRMTPSTSNSQLTDSYQNQLHFHFRHGSLIHLSNNKLTAERKRPFDDFNNGVVMTNRTLKDGELFEIRLDQLVNKWSGSIEVGVTTHSPDHLEIPTTMTNMRSGTVMMSGNGILVNGKGTKRQYGEFNLDDLKEGDRIGLRRSSENELNYYINGVDQGVAASNISNNVWAVVDLYGMTVKVTIIPEFENRQISESAVNEICDFQSIVEVNKKISNKIWAFHPIHGSNVYLTINRTVASNSLVNFETIEPSNIYQRPSNSSFGNTINMGSEIRTLINLAESFSGLGTCMPNISHGHGSNFNVEDDNGRESTVNSLVKRIHRMIDWSVPALPTLPALQIENGVVMSECPLLFDELIEFSFQSINDTLSIAFGIADFKPTEVSNLQYPFLNSFEFASWIQQGINLNINGLFSHINESINFDNLKSNSRIGVIVRSGGSMHFYLDGIDMGEACSDVVQGGYIFINLSSVDTKVTILNSEINIFSSIGTSYGELKDLSKPNDHEEKYEENFNYFFIYLSSNMEKSNNNRTAVRIKYNQNSYITFSEPITIGSRQEFIVQKVENIYSGNFAIGLIAATLMDIQILNQNSDLDVLNISWMIGNNFLGSIANDWPGKLTFKNIVCIERLSSDIFIVLVNNCIVKMISIPTCKEKDIFLVFNFNGSVSGIEAINKITSITDNTIEVTKLFKFSKHYGKNIRISENGKNADRFSGFDDAIIVCDALSLNQFFQIKITSIDIKWSSALSIGLVHLNEQLSNDYKLPKNLLSFKKPSWIFKSNNIYYNGSKLDCILASNLDEIEKYDILKVLIDNIGFIHLYKNNIEITPNSLHSQIRIKINELRNNFHDGISAWYVVVDLYGIVNGISILKDDEIDDSYYIHNDMQKKLENNISISQNISNLIINKVPFNCSFLNRALLFKNSLFLPNNYFINSDPICYCPNCCSFNIKDEAKEKYVPFGWVAFPLKFINKSETKNFEKWQRCYRRMSEWSIRRVLDSGDINACTTNNLIKSNSSLSFVDKSSDKYAPDNYSNYEPVVIYSNLNHESPPKRTLTDKIYVDDIIISAHVAIQGFLKPGSYKNASFEMTGIQKNQSTENLLFTKDTTDCLEWTTKERGSVILSALLICIL